MTTPNIRWFISRCGSIFHVHPNLENGTNAYFKADIASDRVRELKPVGDYPLANDVVDTYMLYDSFKLLVKNNPEPFKANEACFIDYDGVIHFISSVEKNESTAPYKIICDGDVVMECGEHSEGDGHSIEGEYEIHTIPEFTELMEEANS